MDRRSGRGRLGLGPDSEHPPRASAGAGARPAHPHGHPETSDYGGTEASGNAGCGNNEPEPRTSTEEWCACSSVPFKLDPCESRKSAELWSDSAPIRRMRERHVRRGSGGAPTLAYLEARALESTCAPARSRGFECLGRERPRNDLAAWRQHLEAIGDAPIPLTNGPRALSSLTSGKRSDGPANALGARSRGDGSGRRVAHVRC